MSESHSHVGLSFLHPTSQAQPKSIIWEVLQNKLYLRPPSLPSELSSHPGHHNLMLRYWKNLLTCLIASKFDSILASLVTVLQRQNDTINIWIKSCHSTPSSVFQFDLINSKIFRFLYPATSVNCLLSFSFHWFLIRWILLKCAYIVST